MNRRSFLGFLGVAFLVRKLPAAPAKPPLTEVTTFVKGYSGAVIENMVCYEGNMSLGDLVYVRDDGTIAPVRGNWISPMLAIPIGHIVYLQRDFYNRGLPNQFSVVKATVQLT